MEHRWHPRESVAMDMAAECRTLGSIYGRTQNISYGGVLFDTGKVCLAPHTIVTLSCCLLVEERCCSYSVRAQVIYADKNYAGLMFLDHEAAYGKFRMTVLKRVISSCHSKVLFNIDSLLSCSGSGCEETVTAPSHRVTG
ncbi:MAG: PilZ domain-containing protein [Gammaproteobacteria bacterium]|nr:PilZ domain-containing protein [Gammaproteobacteria bacterium]